MKTKKNSDYPASLYDAVRIMVALFMLLTSQLLFAQGRLSVEFRPSANIPTSNFGPYALNAGGGFEAVGAYQFLPHLSAYAGWGRSTFGIVDTFAGPNSHFQETGYTYGLQYIYSLTKDSKINLIIRGGGVTNHIEVENGNGDMITDSGHGFGWQLEECIVIPVGRKWSLLPGLRFRSLKSSFMVGSTETSGTLNYLSLGLGVRWQF